MEMLKDRIKGEECNAGVIFDNLNGDHWPDWKFAIELICDTIPDQNVMLVMFMIQKEGEGEDEIEVCSNPRYIRRKD